MYWIPDGPEFCGRCLRVHATDVRQDATLSIPGDSVTLSVRVCPDGKLFLRGLRSFVLHNKPNDETSAAEAAVSAWRQAGWAEERATKERERRERRNAARRRSAAEKRLAGSVKR